MSTIIIENFNSLSSGDLNGQNGWSGDTSFQLSTSSPHEGAKCIANNSSSSVYIGKSITLINSDTITIWMKGSYDGSPSRSPYPQLSLFEGATEIFNIYWNTATGFWGYKDGTGAHATAYSLTSATWYQFTITFYPDNTADYTVNGNSVTGKTPMASWSAGIDTVKLKNGATPSSTNAGWDLIEQIGGNTGAGDITLPLLTVYSSEGASGDITLPVLRIDATTLSPIINTGNITLPMLSTSGTTPPVINGNLEIPIIDTNAYIVVSAYSGGTLTLPLFKVSGTGTVGNSATANIIFPLNKTNLSLYNTASFLYVIGYGGIQSSISLPLISLQSTALKGGIIKGNNITFPSLAVDAILAVDNNHAELSFVKLQSAVSFLTGSMSNSSCFLRLLLVDAICYNILNNGSLSLKPLRVDSSSYLAEIITGDISLEIFKLKGSCGLIPVIISNIVLPIIISENRYGYIGTHAGTLI